MEVCRQSHLPVCQSVGLLVCLESVLWQKAQWIWMPFGVVSGVGPGIGVLDGVEIVEGEGAVLGVNVGHPIVINGDFVA